MKEFLQDLGAAHGLGAEDRSALESYLESPYREGARCWDRPLPLPDAAFVEIWKRWEEQASRDGAFEVLREHLPQLRFPIREGISGTPEYRAATLGGQDPESIAEATGLALERPRELHLGLHASAAGRIPYLYAPHRPDFETLVQALSRRNEPIPVPPAQGAAAIAGYNNWSRIREHRMRWQATPSETRQHATWKHEMAELRQHKELYQDTFLLLSRGPYGGVDASRLDLRAREWLERSLDVRLEHESTHFFTRRAFGRMRNHLLDELLADYAGLRRAFGSFRSAWFLRCLGLENGGLANGGRRTAGARVEIYRGSPPLSEAAFAALLSLLERAARAAEGFAAKRPASPSPGQLGREVLALARHRLDELAADDSSARLEADLRELEQKLGADR